MTDAPVSPQAAAVEALFANVPSDEDWADKVQAEEKAWQWIGAQSRDDWRDEENDARVNVWAIITKQMLLTPVDTVGAIRDKMRVMLAHEARHWTESGKFLQMIDEDLQRLQVLEGDDLNAEDAAPAKLALVRAA